MAIMPSLTGDEFLDDYIYGMPSMGIPEMYLLTKAVAENDVDQFKYSLKVSGMVHATWYAGYRLVVAWDLARHAGKNVKGLTYHKAMQYKGAATGMGIKRVALATWPVAASALIFYSYFEFKDVGLRYLGLPSGA